MGVRIVWCSAFFNRTENSSPTPPFRPRRTFPSVTTPAHARFTQFPRDLAARARNTRLGPNVPALLAHPDWTTPAPVVLWMHGRTANKELDPGRYLRLIRAGIAVCAIDLPGHGERADPAMQAPERTLDTMHAALAEVNAIIAALSAPEFAGVFDTARVGIGGMSLGGMTTLRRLCDPHAFKCAAVEGTTGWLDGLYRPRENALSARQRWTADHSPGRIAEMDPAQHLKHFAPIPLLAVHSEADQMVPFEGQQEFIARLRAHYAARAADPRLITLISWPETGAPQEHVGFGRFSNDAKNAQVDFFAAHLTPIRREDNP